MAPQHMATVLGGNEGQTTDMLSLVPGRECDSRASCQAASRRALCSTKIWRKAHHVARWVHPTSS